MATSAAPTGAPLLGFGLIANAFSYTFGLFQEVVEEIADVIGNAVDHRKDLLQHISNQVRGRDAKVFREFPDVIGKLFRDPGVDHAFLPNSMSMMTAGPAGPTAAARF